MLEFVELKSLTTSTLDQHVPLQCRDFVERLTHECDVTAWNCDGRDGVQAERELMSFLRLIYTKDQASLPTMRTRNSIRSQHLMDLYMIPYFIK